MQPWIIIARKYTIVHTLKKTMPVTKI